MNVTKLEVLLSALLVVIVCEAGYYLPGYLASYCQGPNVSPVATGTPAKVQAPEETPATSSYSSAPLLRTKQRVTQQESKTLNSLPQTPGLFQDVHSEVVDRATLPLAMVDPPDGFLTNQEQVAAFDMLRQEFADSLSAYTQDPDSPEYRRRWEEAQQTLDDEFRVLFGVEAYNQQQNVAMRAALQQP